MKAVGKFENDQFTGLWKWWRENGNLLQEGHFKNNKQTGIWKRFHLNGKLYDEGNYIDGKKEGEWKTYSENGKLTKTKIYKISEQKILNENNSSLITIYFLFPTNNHQIKKPTTKWAKCLINQQAHPAQVVE